MQVDSRYTRYLWLILIVGLILRLMYALSQPTVELFYGGDGGDAGWYLANGWGFFSGQPHGWIRNVPFYLSVLPTAPFYIVYAGFFQQFFTEHEVILVMRFIQCILGIGTAYLAYRITSIIANNTRSGLLAGVLIAFHPAFIIESANIATETFYIFFLTTGLWLYIEYIVYASSTRGSKILAWIILVGLAFGMATLTRAVLLLFPIGLVIHMLMLGYRNNLKVWIARSIGLIVVYGMLISTWTIYNLGMWDRLVIGSDQLMPALWRGAVQNDGNPEDNDALLLENPEDVQPDGCEVDCKFQHSTETYVEQINESIGGNIGVFVSRRLQELGSSYLQPHGTTPLGSISVREGIVDWLQNDRSLDGLVTLVQIEGFVVKLIIWMFHYGGLVLGLIGIWMSRSQWRLTLPLIGFIAYTTLIHFVLLALPRYIFPVEVVFLIFTAISLGALWNRHFPVSSYNEGIANEN